MKSELTFEEMKFKLREDFLGLISNVEIEPGLVRILDKPRRMELTEEEINKIYYEAPAYYSIYVVAINSKKSGKCSFDIRIGKGSDVVNTNLLKGLEAIYGYSYLRISIANGEQLKAWARVAANKIAEKIYEENQFYLKEVRFDLIPDNDGEAKYLLLNLPLENIRISKRAQSALCMDTTTYVIRNLKNYEAVSHSAYALWLKNHNK